MHELQTTVLTGNGGYKQAAVVYFPNDLAIAYPSSRVPYYCYLINEITHFVQFLSFTLIFISLY